MKLLTPIAMTNKASVKVRMPTTTVRVSRWSRSGTAMSLASGGGSRLILDPVTLFDPRKLFDPDRLADARLTVCFPVGSGLAMSR